MRILSCLQPNPTTFSIQYSTTKQEAFLTPFISPFCSGKGTTSISTLCGCPTLILLSGVIRRSRFSLKLLLKVKESIRRVLLRVSFGSRHRRIVALHQHGVKTTTRNTQELLRNLANRVYFGDEMFSNTALQSQFYYQLSSPIMIFILFSFIQPPF